MSQSERSSNTQSIPELSLEGLTMNTNKISKEETSIESSTPLIQVIPFHVLLSEDHHHMDDKRNTPDITKKVIGTVTIMNSSVLIWVGWEMLTKTSAPVMGPLVISTPGLKMYKSDASSSLLIGSNSDEDQMFATQVSRRLTNLIHKPVLVCSSIHSTLEETYLNGNTNGMNMDDDERQLFLMRAKVYAERKIKEIICE